MAKIPKRPPLPRKIEYPKPPREIRSVKEWEKYISRLIKNIKKIDRRSPNGILNQFDVTDIIAQRRVKAILNTIDMVKNQFDDPEIHSWDPNYIGKRWISICMQGSTYEDLEKEQHILVGAAIWILEQVANDHENRKALFDLLPSDERKLEILYEFSYWHPRYDFDLIQSVVYLLRFRNSKENTDEEDNLPRALTDEASALRGIEPAIGKKESGDRFHRPDTVHSQWYSADAFVSTQSQNRENFEKLISLIPKKSIQDAIQRLKDMFMPWVAGYYHTILPYARKLKEIDDQILCEIENHNRIVDLLKNETDALVKLMKGNRAKNNQSSRLSTSSTLSPHTIIGASNYTSLPSHNDLFQSVSLTSLGNSSIGGDISQALKQDPEEIHLDRIREYYDQFDEVIERYRALISDFENTHNREYQKMNDYITTGGQISTEEELSAGDTSSGKPNYHQISNPYELCFALLYLIDTGDDMPWTYGPCIGMMYGICDNLPWGLYEYQLEDDPIWEDYTAHKFPAQKPASLPDWNDRRFQPKDGTPRSLAQLIYENTGCLMPQDMHMYDGFLKPLRKYGVRAKETPGLLTAMVALGVSRMQIPANNLNRWYDGTPNSTSDIIASENKSGEKSEDPNAERNDRLTLEIKQLRSALYEAERRERDTRKKMEEEREKAEREHRELADLREFVFNQESEDDLEWDSRERHYQQDAIALPYEVQKNTIIFGGHETWVNPIRKMLTGKVRFIERGYTFDTAIIRSSDVIWIQPNAMAHTMYYRIIEHARRLKKPVRYFTNASAALCAQQVAEGDSGF